MKACEGRDRTLDWAHPVENSVYYSDEFKLIACFPLKAGTTNWQKLLGILENGGKLPENWYYGDSPSLRKLIQEYDKPKLYHYAYVFLRFVFHCKASLIAHFPLRQIGAFRPLRRDCSRLRDRRMSWIVSKRRAAVFLSVESLILSAFKKVKDTNITNFAFFFTLRAN